MSLTKIYTATNELIASEYCSALLRGNDLPTVIAFSSVNTKKGKFKPFKIVADAKANIIFVNDSANNWYLKGIEGLAEGAEASAKLLVSAARTIGNGEVMTFGTSMGAYGAILYAALGGADKCMAFGAEVILDLPGSRSALHKKSDITFRYFELLSAIRKSRAVYHLYVSETDDVDMINAISLLGVDRISLFSVRGSEHPGVQVLEDDIGVGKLIDAMFQDADLLRDFERKGLILDKSELVKDLWLAFGLMREKNYGACLDYLLSLEGLYSNNSVFMFRLGEAYYRNKLLSQAVECWEKSIALDGLQYGAYNLLGSVMRRYGRFDEAKVLLNKSIEINSRNPYPYHNLGRVYQDIGEIEKALLYFQGAVDLNSGNKDFAASLNSIKQSINTDLIPDL